MGYLYFLDTQNPVNWINFTASALAGLVSIAAIYFGFKNNQKTLASSDTNIQRTLEVNTTNTDKTIKSKRIEERKNEIYKSLNDFYEPLFQLRQKSNLIYGKFKLNKTPNTSDGRFSTLLYLLTENGPDKLEENDKVLLAEIINIGGECEKLIHEKAGLIDDDKLRGEWFPKVTKHFLILRLAHTGKLKGQSELFSDSMFPTEIDALIKARINVLRSELKSLE
jgi:hypothetical protein